MGLFGNDMTEELQSKINEIEGNISAIEEKISQLTYQHQMENL